MAVPYLLVVTGRPGSGKTTFSKKLGEKLFLPVISRDEIKEGYVHTFQKPHVELPRESNRIVTDIFFRTVTDLIDNNVSVIAEAAFQHKVWVCQLDKLKKKSRLFVLICKVDGKTALDRFIKRGLVNPMRGYFHGDKGVGMAKQGIKLSVSSYDEPRLDVPTFHIDTSNGYRPSIDELRAKIFATDFY
ncbi:MAG: AAA family ATPase [Caldicoprobacterales bacterium]|nr:AAA family ATPase [Clostridiales bacterium]